MTQYEKMTETKIPVLVTKLAIPTVISMLVTAIYNLADTLFVTQIGDSSSAAISVVFSLQSLIQAIGFTIGMGSGALISRVLGKKEDKKASMYASQGILMGVVLGSILLIFGLIFNEQIMALLGATDTAKPYAVLYAHWIFIACPFMISSFIMNNILRSEGKASLSMIGLGIGGVINIALDPLFIYTFNMGISGAGLATMISQMISFSLLASFFIFNRTQSKINFKYLTKDIKSYLEALKIGSPTLFRQGFSTSSNIIINFLAKSYGDPLVSALGVTSKIYLFVRNIVVGIGQGYQPVLGYNYGAKRYDRIKKAFLYTLMLQTIVSILAMLFVLIFSPQIIRWFSKSEAVIAIGTNSIRFLGISLGFLGFSTIINQSLQIIGCSKSASFLASLRQGIVYTPLVFLLAFLLNDIGLCLTQPLSDFITALISIPFAFYFFKQLKKKEEKELSAQVDFE